MRICTISSAHFVRFLKRLVGTKCTCIHIFTKSPNLKEIEIVVSCSTIPLVCFSVFSFGAIGRSSLCDCSIS